LSSGHLKNECWNIQIKGIPGTLATKGGGADSRDKKTLLGSSKLWYMLSRLRTNIPQDIHRRVHRLPWRSDLS